MGKGKSGYVSTKIEGQSVKVSNTPSNLVHYSKGEAKTVYHTSNGKLVTEDHKFIEKSQTINETYNNYEGNSSGEPDYKSFEETL